MLFFQGFARPQLTVIVIPEAQISALQVWQDDFAGDVIASAVAFSNGAGADIDAMSIFMAGVNDASVNDPVMPQGLVTRIDPQEEEAVWTTTDPDQYGALELQDDLAQPLHQMAAFIDDPVSIPRYKQAGTTLDCDTSAPLAGSSVFAHDPTTGAIVAQGVANGDGVFSIPVFQTGPHLVRAVNGVKTAISLPVAAEVA